MDGSKYEANKIWNNLILCDETKSLSVESARIYRYIVRGSKIRETKLNVKILD